MSGQGTLGFAEWKDRPRRASGQLTGVLSALFQASHLLKNGFCLAETGFLCLPSEEAAKWWARHHQLGKESDSRMYQGNLQCHRRVDARVYATDEKGCREMVASTNKRTGLQDFRSRREYSERL